MWGTLPFMRLSLTSGEVCRRRGGLETVDEAVQDLVDLLPLALDHSEATLQGRLLLPQGVDLLAELLVLSQELRIGAVECVHQEHVAIEEPVAELVEATGGSRGARQRHRRRQDLITTGSGDRGTHRGHGGRRPTVAAVLAGLATDGGGTRRLVLGSDGAREQNDEGDDHNGKIFHNFAPFRSNNEPGKSRLVINLALSPGEPSGPMIPLERLRNTPP